MTAEIVDLTRARIERAIDDFRLCGFTIAIVADFGHCVLIDAFDPDDRGIGSGSMRVLIDLAQFRG